MGAKIVEVVTEEGMDSEAEKEDQRENEHA
jgi:hypothetical protein